MIRIEKFLPSTRVSSWGNFSENPTQALLADTGVILESGQWTPPSAGTYEIHCVGGGGGGSSWYGAGGGSGYYSTATMTLSVIAYTVTIGAGGGKSTTKGGAGGAGGQTVFNGPTVVTANGGVGAINEHYSTGAGGAGGSGGGGASNSFNGVGGGGGGFNGSNGGQTSALAAGSGGSAPGTGQLSVGWGLGTNPLIPAGGSGSGNTGGTYNPPGAPFGGMYGGIYGYGAGRAGDYGAIGSAAVGRGCGGAGSNWYDGAGPGAPGMIVWRKTA